MLWISDSKSCLHVVTRMMTHFFSDLVAAINAIKSEVEALRGEVRKKDGTNSISSGRGPRRPTLCSSCFENKKECCNYCFKCGSVSHFARGCRKTAAYARQQAVVSQPKFHQCNHCCKRGGKHGFLKRCSHCQGVWYCSVECQGAHSGRTINCCVRQ